MATINKKNYTDIGTLSTLPTVSSTILRLLNICVFWLSKCQTKTLAQLNICNFLYKVNVLHCKNLTPHQAFGLYNTAEFA